MHAVRSSVSRCAIRTGHSTTNCARSAASRLYSNEPKRAPESSSKQKKVPLSDTLKALLSDEPSPSTYAKFRAAEEHFISQQTDVVIRKAEMKKKAISFSPIQRAQGGRKRKKLVGKKPEVYSGGKYANQRERKKATVNALFVSPTLETAAENQHIFHSTSELKPWKESEGFNDNPSAIAEDRSTPPHVFKHRVLKQDVLMPSDTTLADVEPLEPQRPVDTLAHELDRVLFNPGVHWLQDPRSRVYNFTPWLQRIPQVNDFAFERLTGFVKSSRDDELRALAAREGKQFTGSTSSLSGMLCHIYFLLSEHKEVDYSTLSQHFKNQPASFTFGQRAPATVLMNYKDGIYAVDSHSAEYDDPDKNVLTWLGTLLENFLTKNPSEFKNLMNFGKPATKAGEKIMKEAYRYSKSKNFIMRSQLDCYDPRLPGTGVFDIKTRACVSIRMDILNYKENSGYMIWNQAGMYESFEREYFDLIRSGFLKYSFQARIGNMDGVMVTYHNTERIFGFQYISLDEMDERLFGPAPGVGNKVFNYCVTLLEEIMQEVSKCFPEQSVVCAFETRVPGRALEVYVKPAEWDGNPADMPMKKLIVTLDHQASGLPTRPLTAMRQPDHWSLTYNIGEAQISQDDIKRDYSGLEFRKKRVLVLPSHISTMEDGEKFWENLKFSSAREEQKEKRTSAVETDADVAFQPDAFTLATATVENYREMARRGRFMSRKIEEREAGKPKIVLGNTEPYEEDKDWAAFWAEKRPSHPTEEENPLNVFSSSQLQASIEKDA